MAFCDETSWRMTLLLKGVDERLTFNVKGDGTGTVDIDSGAKMSDLIWACRVLGAGANQRGLLTFHFRFRRRKPATGSIVEAGAMFIGIAREVPGQQPVIDGRVFTFPPDNEVPAGGANNGLLTRLEIDPGDTGTGNGHQT